MAQHYFAATHGSGWCVRRDLSNGASEPVLVAVPSAENPVASQAVMVSIAADLNERELQREVREGAQTLVAALEERLAADEIDTLVESLDEEVHDSFGAQAAEVDNGGLVDQIALLGPAFVLDRVSNLFGLELPRMEGLVEPRGGLER